MATFTIHKKDFKAAVKEGVREALSEELVKFRALLLPHVSSKEQKDIEKRYDTPSRKTVRSMKIVI